MSNEYKLFFCGGEKCVNITNYSDYTHLVISGAHVMDSTGNTSQAIICDINCPNDNFIYLRTLTYQNCSLTYNTSNSQVDTIINNDVDSSTMNLYKKSLYENFYENCVVTVECLPIYSYVYEEDGTTVKSRFSLLKQINHNDIILIRNNQSLYTVPGLL